MPAPNWDTVPVVMPVEIQITTELQDNIRQLLHKYYETRRRQGPRNATKLQWDYRSSEFSASYLGHILHYIEGMVVNLREKHAKEGPL